MMTPPRVLLIGSTSAIADALARRLAARGAALFLVARNRDALAAQAADLTVRGAVSATPHLLDVHDLAGHAPMLDAAFGSVAAFDAVVIAHGTLPDQAACEASVAATLAAFDTNARSTLALLTALAQRFASQGSGVIAVIGSPAGERGRQSNYVYGAAKAAVITFAAGLRHRFHGSGVRVLTIQPGFVDTPMTASFTKGPLWASADRVAADIEAALAGPAGTLYTPWFWRPIMTLIRAIPERIFVRTRL